MLRVATYIDKSQHAVGLGLYSLEDIPKGKVVWVEDVHFDTAFDPQYLIDLCGPQAAECYLQYGYRLEAAPHLFIIDRDNARFLNHHDEPNIGVPAKAPYYTLVALRDIPRGGEMHVDYNSYCMNFQRVKTRWDKHTPLNLKIAAQQRAAEKRLYRG